MSANSGHISRLKSEVKQLPKKGSKKSSSGVASLAAARLVNRRPLFWDISPESIKTALQKNDDWAIVRIFQYGTLDDILDCIELYGKKKVTAVLSSSKLRPMAYAMGHLFLGVDTESKYS
ncbi:MAG: hypothetical protein WDO14_20345 [Bacteroidota bacterium]